MNTSRKNIKDNRVEIENDSFDELEPEISLAKWGPGPSTGGWVPGQSGGPSLPGGECFAPLPLSTMCVSTAKCVENRNFEWRRGRLDGKSCEI